MKKQIFLLLFAVLSAACELTDLQEKDISVSSVSLSQATAETIPGETVQLIATVLPTNASDKTVVWASSNKSVATVSDSGLVTAIAEGSSTITASCGGKSATCQVTVRKATVAVSDVTLDQTDLKLTVGDEELLKATVSPYDATDRAVTWNSSDESIVSVDQNGKVKALKGGTATITAAAGDKSATAFVDVLAITPESVKVEGEGGRFDVTVISQRGYHMSSKPDWVHEISVERQVHHFEVPANNSDQERNGIISFCDDEGVCLACIVSQEGYLLLEAGTGHLDFDLHGGSEEIRVTSTLDWTVSSSENWCVPTPASGSGNGTFTVSVGEFRTEGTRSATLTLKGGGLIQTIEVFQEGIVPFSVTPASVEIGESGGSFEVLVKSSFGYHLDGMSDWIGEVSEQNKKHTFQVAANPLERDRSGFISFCDDNGTSLTVSVKQAAHIPGPDDIDWTRDFYHRSLVMRFTATWCPHCPVMHQTVARALADYPGKLVHVAIHGYDSKLYNDSVAPLISTYRISGYPTSVVDGRVQIHNEGVDIAAPKIIAAAKETESLYGTNTGIAINSSLSGRKVDIQLTAYSKKAGKY